MAISRKVPYESIRSDVWFVKEYYDHPLSGYATIHSDNYVFIRNYQSEYVRLRKMNRCESIRAWSSATLFGVFVGWHWHLQNGNRTTGYRDTWIRRFLYRTVYSRPFMCALRNFLRVDFGGK